MSAGRRLYAPLFVLGAALNIAVNWTGKGKHIDLYPLAEVLWVLVSVWIVGKRLWPSVLLLLFLDSFVDALAMGQTWFAHAPLAVTWRWHAVDPRLLYVYWAGKWGLQVPLRCFAMAWNCGAKKPLFVALGLNLIWITAPQDVLFYFVWYGLYDAHFHYFHYLPPQNFWSLWNMLLLRVPIGVGAGAWLVRRGRPR